MSDLASVYLTGVGAITPCGDYSLYGDWTREQAFAPRREDFALTNYLTTPKTYLDRCSALALAGCAFALQDAELPQPEGATTGIALGTRTGCVDTMRNFWDVLSEKGARLAPPLLFSHSMLNAPASLCAIEWGLQGPHVTLCAGELSGLEAARAAWDALRLGRAQTMLCGGVEAESASHDQLHAEVGAESACFFVLQRGSDDAPFAEGAVLVTEAWFARAVALLPQTREKYGSGSGATGALALLMALDTAAD